MDIISDDGRGNARGPRPSWQGSPDHGGRGPATSADSENVVAKGMGEEENDENGKNVRVCGVRPQM